MDRLSLLLENSKRAIRYWWLLLLVGVILIVAGISVFLYPVQSYLGLSVLFGWLMLVSGVLEAVLRKGGIPYNPDSSRFLLSERKMRRGAWWS